MKDQFNGIIPTTVADLTKLPGVGRKTAILLLNEGYGFFAGIGTDIHVCHVAEALGLTCEPPAKKATAKKASAKNKASAKKASKKAKKASKKASALHVEASLSMWIPCHSFKEVNPIFGSFAQLFTQDLATIKTKKQRDNLKIVIQTILQRIHSPYELELIWFIIARLRAHYQRKEEDDNSDPSKDVFEYEMEDSKE